MDDGVIHKYIIYKTIVTFVYVYIYIYIKNRFLLNNYLTSYNKNTIHPFLDYCFHFKGFEVDYLLIVNKLKE